MHALERLHCRVRRRVQQQSQLEAWHLGVGGEGACPLRAHRLNAGSYGCAALARLAQHLCVRDLRPPLPS